MILIILGIAAAAIVSGLIAAQLAPTYADATWSTIAACAAWAIVWVMMRPKPDDVRAIAYPNNTYAVQVCVRGKWVTAWAGADWSEALRMFKVFCSRVHGWEPNEFEVIQTYRRGPE